MPVERIDRVDDPRLDPYRDLPAHDARRRRDTFVAEAREVVSRLLASDRGVRSVLLTDAAHDALADDLARRPEVAVYVAPLAVLQRVVGFDFHRGCLALGERGAERTLDDVLAARPERLVALDGASNPDNVGGVLRVAHALGADAVLLSPDCCDPLYRKAIRVSMGAALGLPWARVASLADALAGLRAAGFTLLGLTPRGDTDVAALDGASAAPTALIVGAEGDGLRPSTLAAAHRHVRIPMAPGRDSLNLVTACAVALDRLGWARDAVARGPARR